MGETKDDPQGSTLTSLDKGGTTSGGEPVTFTKEQVEKEVSDRLAAVGRDAKTLETREKALDAREQAVKAENERIAQAQREREMAEVEAAKDDPAALTLIQQRQSVRAREDKLKADREELDRDKVQHQGDIESANATKREIAIWDIAQKNTVDAATLKEKCDKFNLQTPEQMEEMAKTMGAKPPPLKPDSGVTRGGVSWRDLSPDEKLRKGLS